MTTATPTAAPESTTTGDSSWRGSLLAAVAVAEWTKLRLVRSTMWALAIMIGIMVGFGSLFCFAFSARYDRLDPKERLTVDPTVLSLRGLFLSTLALGVLGVLVMSSEYASGMIRATLAAVPQRRTLLAAKAIVFGAVAMVISMGSAFAAFGAGQAILAHKHLGTSLTDPTVRRAVFGAGIYLTIVGLLGLALGAILRRTAGAIATLVALVFIAGLLAQALPSPWNDDVSKFLPGIAGLALFSVRPDPARLTPGAALIVLLAWLAASFTSAAILIARRDA